MPEIRDITPPTEFIPEPTTPWWIWSLIALGIIVVLAIIILLIKKNQPARRQNTLLDKTRRQLNQLQNDANNLSPATLAIHISIIIRNYLKTAFKDPAIFETQQEFTLRENALQKLPPEIRSQIKAHLQNLSDLKYEPNQDKDVSKDQAESLIQEAQQLLAHIEIQP